MNINSSFNYIKLSSKASIGSSSNNWFSKVYDTSLYCLAPVPAGINLPMITFSFNPCNVSILPLIDASVNTLVVSWNDAADKNESVSKDALVIPNKIGLPIAGRLPSIIAFWLTSANSLILTTLPIKKSVEMK